MHEIESQFLDAMRNDGIHMDTSSTGGRHPIADGKVHRADSVGHKTRGKKHIWYVLHADKPPSGAYGDYKLGIEGKWTAGHEQAEMSREERAQLKKRMEETAKERAAYTKLLNDNAASIAKLLLSKANSTKASADHPYPAAKSLPAFSGLRQLTHDVKYIIDPEEGEKKQHATAACWGLPIRLSMALSHWSGCNSFPATVKNASCAVRQWAVPFTRLARRLRTKTTFI